MITTEDITLGFGTNNLFENVNVIFSPGNKYGIIGANGAGKSTFLKILAGELQADKGMVNRDPKSMLGMLRQDHFKFDEFSVIDTIYQGHERMWVVMKEREALYAKAEMTDEEGMKVAELETEFMELDGYSAEARASELLAGLGVPQELHNTPMKDIPTNFKFRTLLAQVIFPNPDILLLDEPTNNLDIRSIAWLENFLNEYEGTLVIVSHDRTFLNAVCTHIADIDFGKIQVYTGDYDYYSGAIAIARDNQLTAQARKEKKAAELKSFIQRFGANKSKARQATSRKKQLETLASEENVRPSSRVHPHIIFKSERELGKDIVRLDQVSKSFDGEKVIDNLSIYFEKGEKVAIIGPNGVGKTTLMRLLMQEIEPDSGEVIWGVTTKKSYCPQDVKASLPKDVTLYEYLHSLKPGLDRTDVRGLLGRMIFKGDDGDKKTNVLSGGECVRVTLCRMMLNEGNVLLLDEPTNHLDLESIESLNEGLQKFPGTVFFVTHDREFLKTLATRVIELFPDGSMLDYQGSYEEYLAFRKQRGKH